jgi:hypothetical protein
MKKTLFLFLAALLLSGCNIERELEYNILEFEHNGHAYISFDDMRSNFCVIHSPDCLCSGKEVQE